jgi:hypothetical protein
MEGLPSRALLLGDKMPAYPLSSEATIIRAPPKETLEGGQRSNFQLQLAKLRASLSGLAYTGEVRLTPPGGRHWYLRYPCVSPAMHSAIEYVEMWGTGKWHMVLEFQAILCCEMFSTWVYIISTQTLIRVLIPVDYISGLRPRKSSHLISLSSLNCPSSSQRVILVQK